MTIEQLLHQYALHTSGYVRTTITHSKKGFKVTVQGGGGAGETATGQILRSTLIRALDSHRKWARGYQKFLREQRTKSASIR